VSKPGLVMFVGGELDGKVYCLPELPPRYRAPYMRRDPVIWSGVGQDFPPDAPLDIRMTEYVLTRKDGAYFYVERELMELSNAQGVDPRPALAGSEV
jgi:hypothetical protein